ncbi:MAG: M13 family metallopeptidase N-terminal domain-containing protein [Bacteroidetes bacterium]|nr:M13 family metallopeptidase N-terminal domain-containing protein [Bacteroidota bacterium]
MRHENYQMMKINKLSFLLAFVVLAAFTLERAVPALNIKGMNKSRWGSFNEIVEQNNFLLKQLLENAANNKTALPNSAIDKVGKFYRVFMDTLKRESQGISPVMPYLNQINSITTKEQLIQTISNFHKMGFRCLFNFYVGQDNKNSSSYIVNMGQGGLGLPDKDNYLKNDEKSLKTKKAYLE